MALIPLEQAMAMSRINPLNDMNNQLFKLAELKKQQEELNLKKKNHALDSMIAMSNAKYKVEKLASDEAKFMTKKGAAELKAKQLAWIQYSKADMKAHIAREKAEIEDPLSILLGKAATGELTNMDNKQMQELLQKQAAFDSAAAAARWDSSKSQAFADKLGIGKAFRSGVTNDLLAFQTDNAAWNVANSYSMGQPVDVDEEGNAIEPAINEEEEGAAGAAGVAKPRRVIPSPGAKTPGAGIKPSPAPSAKNETAPGEGVAPRTFTTEEFRQYMKDYGRKLRQYVFSGKPLTEAQITERLQAEMSKHTIVPTQAIKDKEVREGRSWLRHVPQGEMGY